jgi:integrase
MYQRHGAYYYAAKGGPWKRLATDYTEALRALAAFLATDMPVLTVEQLIARYDAEELAQKAEKTRKGRRQEFKKVAEVFGRMRPAAIEPHHVWNYWAKRGKTEQARHEIRALSALLTFARRVGARSTPNPCFGLQLPMGSARDRYVTDDEYLAVRDLAQPMIGYAMDLALLAGMDESTILKLERRHLTDEGVQFERGKTGVFQLIEWNDELRLTVEALKREPPQLRQFLICNRHGRPYTVNGFQSQWQRTMRKAVNAGIARFHFHDLRAKSASDDATDQGAADRLGHADVKLTKRVYRRLPKRARALAILNKPA